MNEEDLLNFVTSIEGKYWHLKIPVAEDNIDSVVVTTIEMYIDRVGEWQEHYYRSDFTDSDLAAYYTYEGQDPEAVKQSFFADSLFKAGVEYAITSAGFDPRLLEDLEPSPFEDQEVGRASFTAKILADYIRETLKYHHS